MNQTTAKHTATRYLPVAVLVCALLLCYGYEIFSFNITIDEDSTAEKGVLSRFLGSIGEGRWAMSVFSLLLPSSVIPVVSTGLAVGLSGASWWLLARKYLDMSSWRASFAASLAGSVPVLAFIFSFSTVAFAIGIANLLLVGFVAGMSSRGWLARCLGVFSAAAAIAVYDSFVIAVAGLALAMVWKQPKAKTALLTLGGAAVSFVISKAIGLLASAVFQSPQGTYTSQFFDLPGLLANPVAKSIGAFSNVWAVIALSQENFGIHSPWLAVAIVAMALAALVSAIILPGTGNERALRGLSFIGILVLPVAAEAVSSHVVLRSMLYFPALILVLASMAAPGFTAAKKALSPALRPGLPWAAAALVVFALLGNAVISNRLFSTAATTYSMDKNLAFDIGQTKDLLLDGDGLIDIPTVVIGVHSWPPGAFTTPKETLGLSMFSFGEDRTMSFLRTHGIRVHSSSPEQSEAASEIAQELPTYPQPGWVSVHEGVLIVNFGLAETE